MLGRCPRGRAELLCGCRTAAGGCCDGSAALWLSGVALFFFPMQSRTELLGGMQEAAGKRCVLLGWQQAVRIGGCDWHRLVLAGVLV